MIGSIQNALKNLDICMIENNKKTFDFQKSFLPGNPSPLQVFAIDSLMYFEKKIIVGWFGPKFKAIEKKKI